MGAGIDLDNVCCDFGNFRAVDHVNVSVKAGEFFSFLGPSGCGKTTILRMISGFTDPTEGVIRIGGKDVRGQRPNQRPTALIFQNLALFPLMPVWENIAFGLEVRGVDKAKRRERAEELLRLVDLPDAGEDVSAGQDCREDRCGGHGRLRKGNASPQGCPCRRAADAWPPRGTCRPAPGP